MKDIMMTRKVRRLCVRAHRHRLRTHAGRRRSTSAAAKPRLSDAPHWPVLLPLLSLCSSAPTPYPFTAKLLPLLPALTGQEDVPGPEEAAGGQGGARGGAGAQGGLPEGGRRALDARRWLQLRKARHVPLLSCRLRAQLALGFPEKACNDYPTGVGPNVEPAVPRAGRPALVCQHSSPAAAGRHEAEPCQQHSSMEIDAQDIVRGGSYSGSCPGCWRLCDHAVGHSMGPVSAGAPMAALD